MYNPAYIEGKEGHARKRKKGSSTPAQYKASYVEKKMFLVLDKKGAHVVFAVSNLWTGAIVPKSRTDSIH